MGKNTIDLKALLESKMGSFEPSEVSITLKFCTFFTLKKCTGITVCF